MGLITPNTSSVGAVFFHRPQQKMLPPWCGQVLYLWRHRAQSTMVLLRPLRWCCVDCVIHHERDVREEQHYTYMWREQAIIEWSWHVSSIVACWHSAKLCAYAARDFRSQQYDLLFFEDLFARTFAKFSVDCRLLNLPEHHAAGPNAHLQLVL